MHLAFEVADVASEIQRLKGMDISLEGKAQ
jgi:hypothetical protein